MKDILTVKEVAEYLLVDNSTAYKYIKRGLLDSFRIGGKIYVTQQALDDFINLSNIGGMK